MTVLMYSLFILKQKNSKDFVNIQNIINSFSLGNSLYNKIVFVFLDF